MILSEIISAVRAEVNDTDSVYWTDHAVTRWVNYWSRALFRQMAQADQSYGMREVRISGNDTSRVRKVNSLVFSYYLPSWVHVVRSVREASTAGDVPGRIIFPYTSNVSGLRMGWRFEGSRRLDLYGYEEAKDLEIRVAKVPALVHSGVVPKTSTSAGEIYIGAPSPFQEGREAGGYLGALFELTGVATSLRDPRGTVSEVVETDTEWDAVSSQWLNKLTVMPAFPVIPEQGDTYQMHPEIPDSHMMYLILLVSRSLLQEHSNTDRLKQIEPVIAAQRADFIDGLRPRQTAGSLSVQPGGIAEIDLASDPDRDYYSLL